MLAAACCFHYLWQAYVLPGRYFTTDCLLQKQNSWEWDPQPMRTCTFVCVLCKKIAFLNLYFCWANFRADIWKKDSPSKMRKRKFTPSVVGVICPCGRFPQYLATSRALRFAQADLPKIFCLSPNLYHTKHSENAQQYKHLRTQKSYNLWKG